MTKEQKIKQILEKRGCYNLDIVKEIEEVYKQERNEQLSLNIVGNSKKEEITFSRQSKAKIFNTKTGLWEII